MDIIKLYATFRKIVLFFFFWLNVGLSTSRYATIINNTTYTIRVLLDLSFEPLLSWCIMNTFTMKPHLCGLPKDNRNLSFINQLMNEKPWLETVAEPGFWFREGKIERQYLK